MSKALLRSRQYTLTSVFVAFCMTGCAYQLVELGKIYFEYRTVNELTIENPSVMMAPMISVCIVYVYILDIEKYNAENKANISNDLRKLTGFAKSLEVQRIQALFTLADIFKYTPNVTDFMDTCTYRSAYELGVHYYKGTACRDIMAISKYQLQGNDDSRDFSNFVTVSLLFRICLLSCPAERR